MNRSTTLPLLLAMTLALPLAALAQTDAALPQAAASTASAAADAPNGSDDQAFQQSADAERRRIADGRAAADARYQQDQRDCWQRFAVNACLGRALATRRATLDVLRHDELALNAQERERRTAARLDEIARKQAESAERNGQRNADAPASAASAAQ
jgi:ketopantoate reductase